MVIKTRIWLLALIPCRTSSHLGRRQILRTATRSFSSSDTGAMSASRPTGTKQQQLEHAFGPGVLESVRRFWFQGLKDDDFVVPSSETMARWFRKDEVFDAACVAQFGTQLETVRSTLPSAADLLEAARPASPLDWLSLLLLLDQIPRNAYRDAATGALPFRVFDPLALDIARRALGDGLRVDRLAPVRYRLAYRFWFYLPLQHAEDRETQEYSVRVHRAMVEDVTALMDAEEEDVEDEDARACRAVLRAHRAGVEQVGKALVGFATEHRDIVARFGRYPHRNQVLNRQATEEEERYLAEGGQSFGRG
ncbi:hypothetical protein VTK73DRAFT_8035 [Phialemonium thermophilum]|uniref:DUF924-domain-containing protein n=1 Tax=Phialemonium thermophilum TaxID=223376 RepID=A0ABR3WAU3_9PEZI